MRLNFLSVRSLLVHLLDGRDLAGTAEGIRRHFNYDRTKRQGLTIANDWHIRYYRGTWKGEPVLIFKHSAIEYIFRHAA